MLRLSPSLLAAKPTNDLSPPAFEGSDLIEIVESHVSHVIHGVVVPPERAKLAEAALQVAKLAG